MNKTLTGIIAGLALLGAGCEKRQEITAGTVDEKVHRPQSDYVENIPAFIGDMLIMIPQPRHIDEAYMVKISNIRGYKMNVKGMPMPIHDTNTLFVTKEAFDRIQKGDAYSCKPKECSIWELPNNK